MLGPHISLLSLLFSVIQGYLPTADLTNSVISPYENLIEKDLDGLGESGSSEIDEPSASPYRNRLTFRRRNMNNGGMTSGPGSSPFSRMNYRTGYGSNRGRGPFNSPNPFANSYNYNGYGSGGGGASVEHPFSSGLMPSRERNFGYFGSTAGMRNKNSYKGKFPNYYEVLSNRPTNDLMGSFNPEMMRGNMPSHKFGAANSFIPQIPNREIPSQYFNPYYPDMSPYGGDYPGRILSNRWNDKGAIGEIDNNGVDGYAASAKQKTQKKTQKKTVA